MFPPVLLAGQRSTAPANSSGAIMPARGIDTFRVSSDKDFSFLPFGETLVEKGSNDRENNQPSTSVAVAGQSSTAPANSSGAIMPDRGIYGLRPR